jgi:hypothetical protein
VDGSCSACVKEGPNLRGRLRWEDTARAAGAAVTPPGSVRPTETRAQDDVEGREALLLQDYAGSASLNTCESSKVMRHV